MLPTSLILLLLALLGGAIAAPTAAPQQCSSVVLPTNNPESAGCVRLSSNETRCHKDQAGGLMFTIRNAADDILRIATNHPAYLNLTHIERGDNTSLSPTTVYTTSLYEIGKAVTFLDQCFLPTLKNLTGSEEELYKVNVVFQFYLLMNTASDGVVELVRTLRILARSDDRLTQGGVCSIPRPTCITPPSPTPTKENGALFTPTELRLRELVNAVQSLRRYIGDVGNNHYWN